MAIFSGKPVVQCCFLDFPKRDIRAKIFYGLDALPVPIIRNTLGFTNTPEGKEAPLTFASEVSTQLNCKICRI